MSQSQANPTGTAAAKSPRDHLPTRQLFVLKIKLQEFGITGSAALAAAPSPARFQGPWDGHGWPGIHWDQLLLTQSAQFCGKTGGLAVALSLGLCSPYQG